MILEHKTKSILSGTAAVSDGKKLYFHTKHVKLINGETIIVDLWKHFVALRIYRM